VHFHCGGEVPILSKQAAGSPSIEYKKYGTQIDCVPILREGQSVRLEISTRLSQLDPSRDVTIGETRVPGLRVHEFDTAGEVKPGQALVIVGPAESRSVLEVVHNMPWFLETASEQMEEFFETHPMAALAASWAVENLGELLYSNTVEIVHEEEIQFVAIVRTEVVGDQGMQLAFNAAAFGCDLGCCEPNACAGQCASANCESLRQPLTGSFAVQPVACWGVPSNGKLMFDHVLIDTPLLPGAVQPALFTAPQSLGSKSLFDFDFQTPVLPPLELALPEKVPPR
jgi:hypothetical protein